jgi:CheY-like chemotaxis protein
MGLAVVHGIVKSHHASISVESKLWKGTTFKILFPAAQEQARDEPKESHECPAGQERILFVDDEDAMVNLNQQRLERLGYKVTGKTDPSEALKLFRSDPIQFDLVITDTTMPHMTGDRLAQAILKIRSDIPVIICTGYSNRISEARAQELGIRKYIEKPIEMENLARSVREVLDGK